MFTIKTRLDKSEIHGMGCISEEFIPKGSVVWRFEPGFDVIISEAEFRKLSEKAKLWISHFGYLNKKEGGYVLCMDDAKYTNHSETPNVDGSGEVSIAIRDIQIGEEITENYFVFDELTGSDSLIFKK